MDGALSSLAAVLERSEWLSPLIAFAAGIITSFSPCSISTVPLVVGYVGGGAPRSARTAFLHSAVFAAGSAVMFVALGVAAGSAGRLAGQIVPAAAALRSVWYFALGILMALMALQIWEVFSFLPSADLLSKNSRRGAAGAFIAGILAGLFSSPCSTPVLVVLLAAISQDGRIARGVLLMLAYAAGNSALVIAAGTFAGFVRRLKEGSLYGRLFLVLRIASGAAVLLLSFYMFYLAF
ncbi:MAG: sulfite exporter TauE/SafE family protein [Treponemataceae bacterium]|nr:sulfite exporter TauE/SafE family protein [Treponemataceae bacterium]